MTGPRPGGPDEGVVAAVLKLTDLSARIERVEQPAARRIEELAASCADALVQVAGLREEAGTLGGRADGIEHKLAEVSALLARMSAQIDDLTAAPPRSQPAARSRCRRPRPRPTTWPGPKPSRSRASRWPRPPQPRPRPPVPGRPMIPRPRPATQIAGSGPCGPGTRSAVGHDGPAARRP